MGQTTRLSVGYTAGVRPANTLTEAALIGSELFAETEIEGQLGHSKGFMR